MKLAELIRGGNYDVMFGNDKMDRIERTARYIGAIRMLMLVSEVLNELYGESKSYYIQQIDEYVDLDYFFKALGIKEYEIIVKANTGVTERL